MDYYLTENIFLRENKMYHTIKSKEKQITSKNWHKILREYGWSKIPLPWVKELNRLSPTKNNNSCFGILDCESDGNCFFHCISNALNEYNLRNEEFEQIDYKDIRTLIANSISEESYKIMINYYRIMKDANDFDEEWDPYQIHSLEDLKGQLRKSGHNYWGDYILLNNVIQILNLNIFILNYNEMDKDFTIYNTLIDFNSDYDSIFLLYEDNCHFKLIGYFDGEKIISYFTDNIPIELLRLYKLR